MAQELNVIVGAKDRARLAAIVGDRSRPLKHVQRAWIILSSADRLPVAEVARRAGVSRPAVWRWQRRFAEEGVDGLLRDKTRPPGRAPLSPETVARVVTMTCQEAPPGETTHWTGRAMAKAVGISPRSVQRIWQACNLQPHRWRTFKRSHDPAFAGKVEDIVGLYMNPPAHAVVLSIDEKSQIQALDRTQPGLPLKPGRCATMTHDYKRNGTTTLFAALNILDGTVIGRCMQRHRHQDAAHKQPKVVEWLKRHPRRVFHFTPTSGSWLNAVESFFSALTRRRIRRGTFQSVVELEAAINRYIAEHNDDPKPSIWTKSAQTILAKTTPTPVPSV